MGLFETESSLSLLRTVSSSLRLFPGFFMGSSFQMTNDNLNVNNVTDVNRKTADESIPDIKLDESSGTTIIACEYDNGIMIGADSRTTIGTSIYNKNTDKIRQLSSNIYCCGSGSSADIQNLCDLVHYHMDLESMELDSNELPLVYRTAKLFQNIIIKNSKNLRVAIIIAGWDKIKGNQIYSLPANGILNKRNNTATGSGSSYILGYVDNVWKPKMSSEECLNFMKTSLSLAISRDSGSGGIINIGILENGKSINRLTFPSEMSKTKGASGHDIV